MRDEGPERAGRAPTRPALARLAIWAMARLAILLILVWSRSWRRDLSGLARLDRYRAEGGPLIAAFWHGNYLPLFALAGRREVTVLASGSFRGEIIATISRSLGYRAELIGGDGGVNGHTVLATALSEPGAMVAIAVDGPLGPRHVAKTGAVAIAAQCGARILPVAAVGAPRLVLWRRWDRMEFPLPFARVALRVGAPLGPSVLTVEKDAAALSSALDALHRDAAG